MYPAGVAGIRTEYVTLRTGRTLRVAQSGDPKAPPVLLLHGWGACLYMFRDPLERFPRAGFRVIAPDLAGHGLSDKPLDEGSYAVDRFLDDVIALLDALDLGVVSIVGQSMGGTVAIHLALRMPGRIAALALISPAGLTPIPYARLGKILGRGITRRLARFLTPRWLVRFILRRIAYGDPSRVAERDVDEYWAQTRDARYVQAVRAMLEEFDWSPLSRERLQAISVPTLVIVGRSDRLVRGLPDAASAIPGATIVITDGGHSANEECPTPVSGELIAFLQEHRKHQAGPSRG
jgi:3-oxoadipate enol-lactonase